MADNQDDQNTLAHEEPIDLVEHSDGLVDWTQRDRYRNVDWHEKESARGKTPAGRGDREARGGWSTMCDVPNTPYP